MAHIIVVGNEKGGAGKSTVSMHVATALARLGHKVSTLDLDLRQRSLGRYFENRGNFLNGAELALPSPRHHDLPEIDLSLLREGRLHDTPGQNGRRNKRTAHGVGARSHGCPLEHCCRPCRSGPQRIEPAT